MEGTLRGAAAVRSDRLHGHAGLVPLPRLKFHFAVYQRKQGVIPALADVCAGMKHRADLTNEDVPCGNELAVEAFDAAHLWIRVATISAAALTFFMSHRSVLSYLLFVKSAEKPVHKGGSAFDADVLDAHRRVFLAVAIFSPVSLAPTVFEDDQFFAPFVTLHGRGHFSRGHRGLTDFDVGALSDEQHREGNLVARSSGESLDSNAVALLHSILFSPGLNHCVHVANQLLAKRQTDFWLF